VKTGEGTFWKKHRENWRLLQTDTATTSVVAELAAATGDDERRAKDKKRDATAESDSSGASEKERRISVLGYEQSQRKGTRMF
jgi:hypothetical protein